MGLPRKGRRVKRKNHLSLYAVNSCTFFAVCRLDTEHIRRLWQSFPTHAPSILCPPLHNILCTVSLLVLGYPGLPCACFSLPSFAISPASRNPPGCVWATLIDHHQGWLHAAWFISHPGPTCKASLHTFGRQQIWVWLGTH